MIILGIDPGLNKTGWGIIRVNDNNISYINTGSIVTNPKIDLCHRINFIYIELNKIIKNYKPNEIAIEKTFININPTSSLNLGHARGAIVLTASLFTSKIFEYSAKAVKKSVTGTGMAEKDQVYNMVKILLPSSNPKNKDESDALAIAICHNNHREFIQYSS